MLLLAFLHLSGEDEATPVSRMRTVLGLVP